MKRDSRKGMGLRQDPYQPTRTGGAYVNVSIVED